MGVDCRDGASGADAWEMTVKPTVLIAASVVALTALGSAASAMSTVPYTGPTSSNPYAPSNPTSAYGIMRTPDMDAVGNPYGSNAAPLTNGGPGLEGPPRYGQRRGGFLNIDPFDPNSVMNHYDRDTYANPYPYDPIYNPYGQSGSPLAPGGGARVPMGNGIPYGR